MWWFRRLALLGLALSLWGGGPVPSNSAFAQSVRFVRGNVDESSALDITDPINILGFSFLGAPATLPCLDSADVDDSGVIDVTDGIALLNFLFLNGPPPAEPFAICGPDPTADTLGCARFAPCPQGPPAPPPPPTIDPYPDITTTSPLIVTGTNVRGSRVEASLDGRTISGSTTGDGRFQVTVGLIRNRVNRIFVTAIRDGLRSAPAPVVVTHDEVPPSVFIDFPAEGATLTAETVTVAGRVSDMLSGFRGLVVTVNGQPANVAIGLGTNGTYERTIPLTLGQNAIAVEATDAVGNTSPTKRVTVIRVVPTGPRLTVVSGNLQTAQMKTWLLDPLVVRLTQENETPIVGISVTFRVKRSDGLLSTSKDGATTRLLHLTTDGNGQARAFFRLGTDAGCGNNRVEVTADGADGTIFFCASATPAPPYQINIGSGNNQRAEVGGPAAEPLKVRVSDGCNGIAGIPVTFTVTRGSGLVNGGHSATVDTTTTGHAEVNFQLGAEPGNNFVEANFPENPTSPATFVVFGVAPSEAQPTTFSGLVLDNANQPIEGATCMIEVAGEKRLVTASDRNGQFRFPDVQGSGAASLRVEGVTATHVGGEPGRDVPEGSYPFLHYETVIVPNAENSLPTPVLLPPLNHKNDRLYDGTRDVELTVVGIEGLRMRVRAGTKVRLFNGTQASPTSPVTLSLNQVHFDDVPMPMPDGATPSFAWTLQPALTTFDPPVSVQMPNIGGEAPGSVATLLSFDHDTGRFEIVATGYVTEDGAQIITDPGTGILKAGWGGAPPPPPPTGDAEGPDSPLPDAINPVDGSDGTLAHRTPGRQGDGRYDPDGNFRRNSRGEPRPHRGVDVVAPIGTPVRSVLDGEVRRVTGPNDPDPDVANLGWRVEISHTLPDGTTRLTEYAHLNGENLPVEGDPVLQGEQIGNVGTTGNAQNTNQPHLHFEVREANGNRLDPTGILRPQGP